MRKPFEKTQTFSVGDSFTVATFNNVLNSVKPKTDFLFSNYLSDFTAVYDKVPTIRTLDSGSDPQLVSVAFDVPNRLEIASGTELGDPATSLIVNFGARLTKPGNKTDAVTSSVAVFKFTGTGSDTLWISVEPKDSVGTLLNSTYTKDVVISIYEETLTAGDDLFRVDVSDDYLETISYGDTTYTYYKTVDIIFNNANATFSTLSLDDPSTGVIDLLNAHFATNYPATANFIFAVQGDGASSTLNDLAELTTTPKRAVFYHNSLTLSITSAALTQLNSLLDTKLFTAADGTNEDMIIFAKISGTRGSDGSIDLLNNFSNVALTDTGDIIDSWEMNTESTGNGAGCEFNLIPLFKREGNIVSCIDGSTFDLDSSTGDFVLNHLSAHDHSRVYYNDTNNINVSSNSANYIVAGDSYFSVSYSGGYSLIFGDGASSVKIGESATTVEVGKSVTDVKVGESATGEIQIGNQAASVVLGSGATSVNIGYDSATGIDASSVLIRATSLNVGPSATTLNVGASATTLNIGASSGTVNIGYEASDLLIGEHITSPGEIYIGKDSDIVIIEGASSITIGESSASLELGKTATTLEIGEGATTVSLDGGSVTIGSVSSSTDSSIVGDSINLGNLDGSTETSIVSSTFHIKTTDGSGGQLINDDSLRWVKVNSGVIQTSHVIGTGWTTLDGFVLVVDALA